MQLSLEERLAVENGQPFRFVIRESGVECVVIRADRQDELLSLISFGDCPIDDLMRLTAETFEDEDWEIPDDRGRPQEPSTK